MKKRFAIGGAIVGFLCGSGIMAWALIAAPGVPGFYELMFQAVLVGVVSLAGALAGLLLGWLVSACLRMK
jgi:hypothetical protein